MKPESNVLRIAGGVVRIGLLVIAAMFVMRVAKIFYNYGYEIFAQTPVSGEPGRIVTVTVEKGDSVRAIGEMLEEKGLIPEDPLNLLFRLQERFSENHGKIAPGTYELSTAMSTEQMIQIMSAQTVTLEETVPEGSSELGGAGDADLQPPPEGGEYSEDGGEGGTEGGQDGAEEGQGEAEDAQDGN
ncbi:MAG: endolytic transglycosylase MltG [Lachnospiraceae bacterium]|nr:endolytic transglycosylase MltG [Lachnospiraceae bacterium]